MLSAMRMPTTRNEEYRFTDISALTSATLVSAGGSAAVDSALLDQLRFPESTGSCIVLVNGRMRPDLSDLSALPKDVYVGGAAGAPAEVLQRMVRPTG